MRELQRQSLDWIERAPLALAGEATTTASPEAVFAVLADHERWPEWFPNVRKVEVIGPAEGVGAQRRVTVPGLVVEEEFIAWDPGVRWSFTGLRSRPGFARSLVEDCRLEATGSGGTSITYTMYLDPRPGFGLLTRLSAPRIRKSIGTAMTNLAARAAG